MKHLKPRILIVDDDKNNSSLLKEGLELFDIDSEMTHDGVKGIEIALKENWDCLLLDLNLPLVDGRSVLAKMAKEKPFMPIIIITGFDDLNIAIETIKAGAFDYLTKPLDLEKVATTIKKALNQKRLIQKEAVEEVKNRLSNQDEIIFDPDSPVSEIVNMSKKVATSEASILITGESGTGKEVIARYIHKNSNRASNPFIEVNCAAIPGELLESEFFGHEKGSFTGAVNSREGLFQIADKGTLFLDEIGDMPLNMQVKLLRALQFGEIKKVGSSQVQTVDVRVIAATSKNLNKAILDGTFREDLFYRLNVIHFEIPPLRLRKIDIPPLINYFLKTIYFGGKKSQKIEKKALNLLCQYDWPGNIRELKNTIERLLLFSNNQSIDIDLVQKHFQPRESSNTSKNFNHLSLAELELWHINNVLESLKGNKTKAAKILGVTVQTLYNKLNSK